MPPPISSTSITIEISVATTTSFASQTGQYRHYPCYGRIPVVPLRSAVVLPKATTEHDSTPSWVPHRSLQLEVAVPEGDAVYLAARRMAAALSGERLTQGELRHPRLAEHDLSGLTVLGVHSVGKHLLTRFDDGRSL